MYLRDIDYLRKNELDQNNPGQNHYKFKEIREDEYCRKYLIITDSESADNLWKIFLSKKLAIEIAQIKSGEWFYIIYKPTKSKIIGLDSNHLIIKQSLDKIKDIDNKDFEFNFQDIEEWTFSDFPVFPGNID